MALDEDELASELLEDSRLELEEELIEELESSLLLDEDSTIELVLLLITEDLELEVLAEPPPPPPQALRALTSAQEIKTDFKPVRPE